MTTSELIAELQRLDPEGTMGVGLNGECPVHHLRISPTGTMVHLMVSGAQDERSEGKWVPRRDCAEWPLTGPELTRLSAGTGRAEVVLPPTRIEQ